MTEEKLLDEILILFIAGHETTSNALCFTTQLLAQNPAKQEKLEEQISKHSNNSNLIERLKCNTYANFVIEESMRLFPPVYFIDRVNIAEVIHNDYIIPKETDLLFSIYEIHRNPKLWDHPESFIPERFADAKSYTKHYFPFGAGPRKCIGNMFAMYEMNLVLQELIKKFKIEATKPNIEILPLISLKPKNAILKFSLKN
jgi:cytochrome P450